MELVEPSLFPRIEMLKCQVNSQLFTQLEIDLGQESKRVN